MRLLATLVLLSSITMYSAEERKLKRGEAQKVAQDIYDKAIAQQLLRMGKPDVNRIIKHINSRIERLRLSSEDDAIDIYEAINKLLSNLRTGAEGQNEARKNLLQFLKTTKEEKNRDKIDAPAPSTTRESSKDKKIDEHKAAGLKLKQDEELHKKDDEHKAAELKLKQDEESRKKDEVRKAAELKLKQDEELLRLHIEKDQDKIDAPAPSTTGESSKDKKDTYDLKGKKPIRDDLDEGMLTPEQELEEIEKFAATFKNLAPEDQGTHLCRLLKQNQQHNQNSMELAQKIEQLRTNVGMNATREQLFASFKLCTQILSINTQKLNEALLVFDEIVNKSKNLSDILTIHFQIEFVQAYIENNFKDQPESFFNNPASIQLFNGLDDLKHECMFEVAKLAHEIKVEEEMPLWFTPELSLDGIADLYFNESKNWWHYWANDTRLFAKIFSSSSFLKGNLTADFCLISHLLNNLRAFETFVDKRYRSDFFGDAPEYEMLRKTITEREKQLQILFSATRKNTPLNLSTEECINNGTLELLWHPKNMHFVLYQKALVNAIELRNEEIPKEIDFFKSTHSIPVAISELPAIQSITSLYNCRKKLFEIIIEIDQNIENICQRTHSSEFTAKQKEFIKNLSFSRSLCIQNINALSKSLSTVLADSDQQNQIPVGESLNHFCANTDIENLVAYAQAYTPQSDEYKAILSNIETKIKKFAENLKKMSDSKIDELKKSLTKKYHIISFKMTELQYLSRLAAIDHMLQIIKDKREADHLADIYPEQKRFIQSYSSFLSDLKNKIENPIIGYIYPKWFSSLDCYWWDAGKFWTPANVVFNEIDYDKSPLFEKCKPKRSEIVFSPFNKPINKPNEEDLIFANWIHYTPEEDAPYNPEDENQGKYDVFGGDDMQKKLLTLVVQRNYITGLYGAIIHKEKSISNPEFRKEFMDIIKCIERCVKKIDIARKNIVAKYRVTDVAPQLVDLYMKEYDDQYPSNRWKKAGRLIVYGLALAGLNISFSTTGTSLLLAGKILGRTFISHTFWDMTSSARERLETIYDKRFLDGQDKAFIENVFNRMLSNYYARPTEQFRHTDLLNLTIDPSLVPKVVSEPDDAAASSSAAAAETPKPAKLTPLQTLTLIQQGIQDEGLPLTPACVKALARTQQNPLEHTVVTRKLSPEIQSFSKSLSCYPSTFTHTDASALGNHLIDDALQTLSQAQQIRTSILAQVGKIPPAELDHALTTTNMAASMCFNAAEQVKKGNFRLASRIIANANYGLECAKDFISESAEKAKTTGMYMFPFIKSFFEACLSKSSDIKNVINGCFKSIAPKPESKEKKMMASSALVLLAAFVSSAMPPPAIIFAISNGEAVATRSSNVLLEYVSKVSSAVGIGTLYKFFESHDSGGGEKGHEKPDKPLVEEIKPSAEELKFKEFAAEWRLKKHFNEHVIDKGRMGKRKYNDNRRILKKSSGSLK